MQDVSTGKFTQADSFENNAFKIPHGSNGPFKVVVAVRDPKTNECVSSRYWSRVNTVTVK